MPRLRRQWGSAELAAMLLGGGLREGALAEGLQVEALGCLKPAAALGRLDIDSVSKVRSPKAFAKVYAFSWLLFVG